MNQDLAVQALIYYGIPAFVFVLILSIVVIIIRRKTKRNQPRTEVGDEEWDQSFLEKIEIYKQFHREEEETEERKETVATRLFDEIRVVV
jgi:hypothetical protein